MVQQLVERCRVHELAAGIERRRVATQGGCAVCIDERATHVHDRRGPAKQRPLELREAVRTDALHVVAGSLVRPLRDGRAGVEAAAGPPRRAVHRSQHEDERARAAGDGREHLAGRLGVGLAGRWKAAATLKRSDGVSDGGRVPILACREAELGERPSMRQAARSAAQAAHRAGRCALRTWSAAPTAAHAGAGAQRRAPARGHREAGAARREATASGAPPAPTSRPPTIPR